MNEHNIPQNKKQSDIYLKGALDFANGLQAKLSTTDTRKMKISEVSDYLNCQMILIENMLEGADYEEAANLDHMTENQFNV